MRSGRYESSENSKVGSAVTFLLIGLGAGALVALLLAPKAGKQFRRDLKRGYEEAKDTLQEWGEEARDRAQEAKEKVLDVAERGAGWAEELREVARETARKVEPLRRVHLLSRWDVSAEDCGKKSFDLAEKPSRDGGGTV